MDFNSLRNQLLKYNNNIRDLNRFLVEPVPKIYNRRQYKTDDEINDIFTFLSKEFEYLYLDYSALRSYANTAMSYINEYPEIQVTGTIFTPERTGTVAPELPGSPTQYKIRFKMELVTKQ